MEKSKISVIPCGAARKPPNAQSWAVNIDGVVHSRYPSREQAEEVVKWKRAYEEQQSSNA